MRNSIVFSGRTSSVDVQKRLLVSQYAQRKAVIFLDYNQTSAANDYSAVQVQLGDLVPYLNAKDCVRLFSDYGRIGDGDGFRFMAERFIALFQKYAHATGASLLDTQSWSMLEMLNDPYPPVPGMQRFLKDNYNRLSDLENYISHIADMVCSSGVDVRQTVHNQQPMYFHFDPSENEADTNKTAMHLITSITRLFPPEETAVFADGVPALHVEPFKRLIVQGGYDSLLWFDDLFALPKDFQISVIDKADKAVFFKHNSPAGILGIFEILGMHPANEVTVNTYPGRRSFGMHRIRPIWSDLSVLGSPDFRNTGISVSKKEKPYMYMDEIARLSENEAIVLTMADRSFSIVNVS